MSSYVEKMTSQFRLSIIILLMFILGGTSQNFPLFKVPIYFLSLVLIGFSGYRKVFTESDWRSENLIWILSSFIIVALAIQLIPMPPEIWTRLPGRAVIVNGYQKLGMELPWQTATLSPEVTLQSSLGFLPPLAIFLYVTRIAKEIEIRIACRAIIGLAIVCVIFGGVQMVTKNPALYVYDITNLGFPTAMFSNTNHFATFLLMTIPLAYFYSASAFRSTHPSYVARMARGSVFSGAVLIMLIGALSTQSLAGVLILSVIIPIFILMTYLSDKSQSHTRKVAVVFAIVSGVVGSFIIFDILSDGGVSKDILKSVSSDSYTSRKAVYLQSPKLIQTYFPLGSGLGSFRETYALQETIDNVNGNFIPHAHNDYLEIIIEYGFWAFVFVGTFFVWMFQQYRRIILCLRSISPERLFAFLAIVVVLLHSAVDYPMRTITISCYFAFCVGLLCKQEKKKMTKTNKRLLFNLV